MTAVKLAPDSQPHIQEYEAANLLPTSRRAPGVSIWAHQNWNATQPRLPGRRGCVAFQFWCAHMTLVLSLDLTAHMYTYVFGKRRTHIFARLPGFSQDLTAHTHKHTHTHIYIYIYEWMNRTHILTIRLLIPSEHLISMGGFLFCFFRGRGGGRRESGAIGSKNSWYFSRGIGIIQCSRILSNSWVSCDESSTVC